MRQHAGRKRTNISRLAAGALWLGGSCVLYATSTDTARAAAIRLSGLWTGMLVADQGECPIEQASTLDIRHNDVTFAPANGALVLHGRLHPDGTVHADLLLSDRSKKKLPMVFEGHPSGDTITGIFGTPSCRAHIVLKRAE